MQDGSTENSDNGSAYRYQRFTTGLLLDDLRFGKEALAPGGRLPESDVVTTEGERFKITDFIKEKPLLLVFGSMTCPMTQSSKPTLKRLYSDYGDKVAFVMLNVREAHPGETWPQPETPEEKLEHARALKASDAMPWTVAADDIDGSLHRALDTKPNAAYLIDRDGTVVFRSLWARDEGALRRALDAISQGERPPKPQSRAMLLPVSRAVGSVDGVIRGAGSGAQRDMWRAFPPMAMAALFSRVFWPLSPDWRGLAAVSTLTAAPLAVVVVLLIYLLA